MLALNTSAITAAGATVVAVAAAVVAAASALGWAAAAGGGVVAAGAAATGAGVTTVGTGAVGRTELRFAPTCINVLSQQARARKQPLLNAPSGVGSLWYTKQQTPKLGCPMVGAASANSGLRLPTWSPTLLIFASCTKNLFGLLVPASPNFKLRPPNETFGACGRGRYRDPNTPSFWFPARRWAGPAPT